MRLVRILFRLSLAGLAFLGCDGGGNGRGGFIPTGDIIAVAERSGANVPIKVGGTAGTVPPGSFIEVTNLNTGETQTTIAASDGSFDPTFIASTNDMFNVVVSDNQTIVTDITIGVTIISQAVRRNIAQLGSVPTTIEIQGENAFVLNGFFNNIQIFGLDEDPPRQVGTIVLPPGSDPVAIAFLDDSRAHVANAVGQSVAIVNVETRECETILVRARGDFSPCQTIVVVGDVFEDPSGVAIANGKVYVSNNNLNEFFQPAGSGFVSVFNAETNEFIEIIDASGANSGGMTVVNDNIFVVNSGNVFFDPQAGDFTCDFDFEPSIDIIDSQSNTISDTINIPLSTENPAVCLPNRLEPTPDGNFGYTGLGLVGALLKVDLQTNTIINGTGNPIIVTDLSGLNFTADIEIRDDGLGFTTLFNTDQIAVIDTNTDTVNPFPFVVPFPAGLKADNPDSDFFEGVQSLAIRPGVPGIDFQGADIFFITGLSEQLGSVNTALILPPE